MNAIELLQYKQFASQIRRRGLEMHWLIALILARPWIDLFYDVRVPGIGISLLELAGGFTYLLMAVFGIVYKKQPRGRNSLDKYAHSMLWMLIIPCVFFLSYNLSLANAALVAKILLFPTIYWYMRLVLHTKADLECILTALLLSAIFPLGMMMYEVAFGAIQIESSRGLMRIRGFYSDLFIYSSYLIITIGIVGSRVLSSAKPMYMTLLTIAAFGILGVVYMNHNLTTVTTAALIHFLVLKKIRKHRMQAALLAASVGIIGLLVYQSDVIEFINKGFSTEIGVIQGEIDPSRSFHGRMFRWENYFEEWLEMPGYVVLTGVAYTEHQLVRNMMSAGMHSDYVRMFFTAGIPGVFVFSAMFIGLLRRGRQIRNEGRTYLCMHAALMVLLFAVTSLPLLYSVVCYYVSAVMVSYHLPESITGSSGKVVG